MLTVARAKKPASSATDPASGDDSAFDGPDAPVSVMADTVTDSTPPDDASPRLEGGIGDAVSLSEPIFAESPAGPFPAPATKPTRAEPPQKRAGSFFPTFAGGVAAAGLGAGAVLYALPQGWRPADSVQVEKALAAQSDRIDSLAAATDAATRAGADTQAAVEAQKASGDAIDPQIDQRLALLDTALSDMSTRLQGLDASLTALEQRPVAGGGASAAAVDAVQSEMAALRKMIEDQQGSVSSSQAEIAATADEAAARIKAAEEDAARLRDEAAATAKAASARAAVSHVQAALESGASMEAALADIAAAGIAVPPDLANQATGVPSLANLRTSFPNAARDALTLSLRETAGDSTLNRIGAFLRSQTGARSLTPRAGDDPDAVLSRAEAALGTGDLSAAIAELAALPEAGQARMAEWIALANRRIAATDAVASLAASVN
jgi:hypothetical protein